MTSLIHVFVKLSGKSSAGKRIKQCVALLIKSSFFRRNFAPF